MDEFLTRDEHIEILTKKLSAGLGALKRTRVFVTKDLYTSF